jgi:hypothetical protein
MHTFIKAKKNVAIIICTTPLLIVIDRLKRARVQIDNVQLLMQPYSPNLLQLLPVDIFCLVNRHRQKRLQTLVLGVPGTVTI